jgi:hypothetical protein
VSAAHPLRRVLACCAFLTGAGGSQAAEDLAEEARAPQEQLGRRQNEVHFGVLRTTRHAGARLDTDTRSTTAFMAYSRGVSERLELGALLPFVLHSERTSVNDAGRTVRAEGYYGVGDPTFRLRYAARRGGDGMSLTFGALFTPDWGGRFRSFGAAADTVEPFVVLARRLGATQAYLRYGYAHRSGDTPDAHRLTLGARHPLADDFGVLGSLHYVRNLGSPGVDPHGVVGGSLGGYATLANGMLLLAWFGTSGLSSESSTGRVDDSRTRQIALSLVHRF